MLTVSATPGLDVSIHVFYLVDLKPHNDALFLGMSEVV